MRSRQGSAWVVILIVAVLLAGGIGLWTIKARQEAGDSELGVSTVGDQATVQIEYTLTVDGSVVDSSEGRGPLSYVHGSGQIIPGLEQELEGMHVGEEKTVVVEPDEAYGLVNPAAFVQVPREQMPPDTEPRVGALLQGADTQGRPFQARISEVGDETVTLDLNHPLAGKTLHFAVKVVDIAAAPVQ